MRARIVRLAWGAIIAQAVFTVGWLLGSALQDAQYSSARHDLSDLGALTAQHPWVMLTAQGITGVLTIAFALGALRPALSVPGHRTPISAWLVAASVVGLDNLSDAFFRLDCRLADPGCTDQVSIASWHGQIHSAVGGISFLLTIAAPFALTRRMRLAAGWRDLTWPTFGFGILFLVSVVAYIALIGSDWQGYAQRVVAVLASVGIVALAVRVRRLAAQPASVVAA